MHLERHTLGSKEEVYQTTIGLSSPLLWGIIGVNP